MTAPQTVADVQHTPGPWAVLTGNDHDFSVDHDGRCDGLLQGVVASAYKVIGNPEMDEMAVIVVDMNEPNCWDDGLLDANVALVTAAPQMVKALEALLHQALQSPDLLRTEYGQQAIEQARAALRAAATSARQGEKA